MPDLGWLQVGQTAGDYKGPDYIHYGDRFKLKVDNASEVKMVSLIRTGSATQTLAQDQLYVRVPFKVVKKGDGDGDDDDHGHGAWKWSWK